MPQKEHLSFVAVRMPPQLHELVKQAAREQSRSVSNWISFIAECAIRASAKPQQPVVGEGKTPN